MRDKLSRFAAVTICLAICLTMAVGLVGCNDDAAPEEEIVDRIPLYNRTESPQKAIIILPGILGSNLVDGEGKALWSAGALISNLAMNDDMLDSEGNFKTEAMADYLKSFLLRDESGNTLVAARAATTYDADLEYGFLGSYGELYGLLNERFGRSTAYNRDVVVFQYDWTRSCRNSAEDLNELIDKNKYTDVLLVGHSMGGIVIDNYLSMFKGSRNNVRGVITLGTPHFGAVDAACLNLGGMMPAATSLMDSSLLKSVMSEMEGRLSADINYVSMGVTLLAMLRDMARTLPSAYELFPTDALAKTQACAEKSPYIIGGTADVSAVAERMKTLSWASKNAFISSIAESLKSGQQSLYEGETFVADAVDTYYIAGNGSPTTCSASFSVSIDFIFTGCDRSNGGDSLVLVDSAVAGHGYDEENVKILDGVDHLALVKVGDASAPTEAGTAVISGMLRLLADKAK